MSVIDVTASVDEGETVDEKSRDWVDVGVEFEVAVVEGEWSVDAAVEAVVSDVEFVATDVNTDGLDVDELGVV